MPKASLFVAVSTHLTVSVGCVPGAVLPMTCPVLSHLPVRTFACVCGILHYVARMQASDLARVGARACADARAACSPALGRGLRPFRLRREPAVRARAFPACPTACSPSRLSLLSGAARSAPPRRLIDFRLRSPVTRLRSPVARRPAIQPALALPSVAAFPLCAPAKSGASGCSTGAAV
jgi:hypothetical protein